MATAGIAVAAILFAPREWFAPVFGVLMLAATAEFLMLSAKRIPAVSVSGMTVNLAGVMIIAFAFSALAVIAMRGGNWALLYVIACVKLSDMGGFAFGTAFGRHKMCPSVSPNKSWEGMAGSVLASCVVSCCFLGVTGFAVWKALLIGVIAAVVGTAGDLFESRFKRWVGVKDSGTFMPAGLGGLLDMFDSLLFAPALIWLICRSL